MIIADETDAAAHAKWELYKSGADKEALAWLRHAGAADTSSGADTNVRQMADPTSAVNINMGTLVGSYATVARMLDEVAAVPGTEGVLLTFDDFVPGSRLSGADPAADGVAKARAAWGSAPSSVRGPVLLTPDY